MYEQEDIQTLKEAHNELLWYVKWIAIAAIGIPIILWVVSKTFSTIKNNHREVMASVVNIADSLPRP